MPENVVGTPRLGFADGWRWLGAGWARYRRHPFFLSGWWLTAWLMSILLNLVPWLGPILSGLIWPFLTVGLMTGCRALDRADAPQGTNPDYKTPRFGEMFSGFASGKPLPLLALGVLQILVALATIFGMLAAGLDGTILLHQVMSGNTADGLPTASPDVSPVGLLSIIWANVLVSLVLCYASLLIGWRNFSLGKALFFSVVATGRAWRGLLGLLGAVFVSMFVFCGLLPSLVLILLGAILGAAPIILAFLLLVLLILAPTLLSTLYTSYCAIFPGTSAPVSMTGEKQE